MRCDLDKVPSVGLFGMVVHQGGLRATEDVCTSMG